MADGSYSPFVGRDAEIRRLRAAVDAALAGHGSTFLLTGQPGIGKTRLATEARQYAESAGARTVHASSWDPGGAPAFWPWRVVAQTLGLDALGAGRVVTEAADDGGRFRLFSELLDQLRRASTAQPIVILLDDLHEADLGTMLLTRFIAEGIADTRVMIMGTYRPGDLAQRNDPVEAILSHLDHAARQGGVIELGGLGTAEVGRLLDNLAGAAGVERVGDHLVDRITRLTQGNPLFVEHLVPKLADGSDALDDLDVPGGIRRVLGGRLDWLAPDTRRLLQVAAVAGPDVDVDVLAEVAGVDADDVSRALAPKAELVFVRIEGQRVSFQHPLMREVLLAELDGEARRGLHESIADRLHEHRRADSEEEVAYHLQHAGPGRAVDAAKASAAAAERALDALAFEDAVTHAQRAVDALDRAAPGSAPRELERLRADLLMELGKACWRASRRPECDAAFDEAYAIALRLDDTERLTRSALAGGFTKAFTTEFPNERAERCRHVLARLGPEPSIGRSLLLSKLACELIGQPDPTDARSAALEALAVARAVDDQRCIGEGLAAVLVTDLGPDHVDDRIEQAEEMLAISNRTGDVALAVQARFQLVGALIQRGDRERVDAVVTEQHRGVHALAEPGYLRHDVWFRCMLAAVDGDVDGAETLADEGLHAANLAHDPDALIVWGGQLGVARWMQGRINELEPLYRDMATTSSEPVWAGVLAWLWSRNGMHAASRGLLDRLTADHLRGSPRDRNWLLAAVTAAEVASRVGTKDEIDDFIDLIEPYRNDLVPIAMGISFWGSVARPLALLYAARGDVDDAIDTFHTAITVTSRFGGRAWMIEAQLDLAELLLRHRSAQSDDARQLIAEAATGARGRGLVELEERAGRLVAWADPPADASEQGVPEHGVNDVADSADVRVGARIHVLDGFRCFDTAGSEVRWSSRRARLVLKLLVAARGRRVTRDVLMERCWPGDDPAVVANRLSVALSTIRRSLDPDQIHGRNGIVAADRETVWIRDDVVTIDLEVFVAAAERALRHLDASTDGDLDEQLSELLAASSQFTGVPFADDPYDDEFLAVREHTSVLYAELNRSIAGVAATAGRRLTAAQALNDLLVVDPFDEAAHQGLIELHESSGAHGLRDLAAERYRSVMGR